MSDEKKGKVFLISMTVIIVLLFLSQGAYPKYKAGKYEEEQKKIAAEQKKVDAKAEDYIEEYASQLQDKMRLAGVDDLIVTYDDLTDDIFKKYTSSEEVNYTYYYAVSYSSESIDQIYAEDTKDGSYESFIRLMENEQNVMNEGHAPGDHNHDIEYGDQTITVYIGNADRSSAINIKGHQGTEYCLDTSNGQSKLLVGGVTVNAVQEEESLRLQKVQVIHLLQVADLVVIPLIHQPQAVMRPPEEQILMMYTIMMIQMILQRSGQRNLEMETMTMDTTMRMITGKMHGIDNNKEMKGYRHMKRKMNFRQILALVCAIIIPVLYIITIILLIAGNPYGQLFLAISFGVTFFLIPIMYLVTKLPKDMAEIYGNVSDALKKEEDKNGGK